MTHQGTQRYPYHAHRQPDQEFCGYGAAYSTMKLEPQELVQFDWLFHQSLRFAIDRLQSLHSLQFEQHHQSAHDRQAPYCRPIQPN